MKQSTLLTVSSLLSILFLTFHLTSDFLHDAGELSLQGVLIAALILVVLLWGTLVLAERRSGHELIASRLLDVIHFRRASGEEYHASVADILYHLVTHGYHHRGQLAALCARAGVPYPSVDHIDYLMQNRL